MTASDSGSGSGDGTDGSPGYRLAVAPGVHPDRWLAVWRDRLPDDPLRLSVRRDAIDAVRAGAADAAVAPVPDDTAGLSVVRLYEEVTVVVVPRDHWVTAADEVTLADLDGLVRVHGPDDPGGPGMGHGSYDPGGSSLVATSTADALDLVAAGVGVAVVPLSVARLHSRRDLTHRPVPDAVRVAVAMCWPTGHDEAHAQELAGIVRGRTAGSSRSTPTPAAPHRVSEAKIRGRGNDPAARRRGR